MTKGISINIGLNAVNPGHYRVEGRLKGCENDASLMAEIARSRNFEVKKLIGRDATTTNVKNEILAAREALGSGDILVISYSGHGGQMKDTNRNEQDGADETWCLFDRQLIDDELFELWTKFKEGVRILVISDSCHSGTVTASINFGFSETLKFALRERALSIIGEVTSLNEFNVPLAHILDPEDKELPAAVLQEVFESNAPLYEFVQSEVHRNLTLGQTKDFRELVSASVLLISACQDWQVAKDGNVNGLFTNALKEVWDGGNFGGNYVQFHEKIWKKIQSRQSPNYYKVGVPNSAFELQPVFSIE